MTRDDLARLRALDIDFESIGLLEPGVPQEPYFCTPLGAEHVGRTGCDGVHFVLLPGDERIFCVDPAMGEPDKYVLPVAEDLRQFLPGQQPHRPALVDGGGTVPLPAGGGHRRPPGGL